MAKDKWGLHQLVFTKSLATHRVVKKHNNNSQAMHIFETTYKKPQVSNPYEKLGRASL